MEETLKAPITIAFELASEIQKYEKSEVSISLIYSAAVEIVKESNNLKE
jgi:hypothetical protein